MALLMPLVLVSIRRRVAPVSGMVSLAGFLGAFTGSLLFACVQFDETLLWPVLAEEAPELLDQGGSMFSDPGFSLIYLLMGLLFITGFFLLGAMILRGSIYPKTTGWLLIAGVPLFAAGMFVPFWLRTAGAMLAGCSLVWIGWSMKPPESMPPAIPLSTGR